MAEKTSISRNIGFLIIAAILIVAGGYFFIIRNAGWPTFKDDANKVQFSFPEQWSVGSSKGFIKLISNPVKPGDLNMLIKVDPAQFFVDYLNLNDSGTKLTLGDKNLTIAEREETVPGGENQATSTMTFTHLYWKDKNGRGYIFEISPWQKNGLDSNLIRVLTSFGPL